MANLAQSGLKSDLSSPAVVQLCSDQCNPTAPGSAQDKLDLVDPIYHSSVCVCARMFTSLSQEMY